MGLRNLNLAWPGLRGSLRLLQAIIRINHLGIAYRRGLNNYQSHATTMPPPPPLCASKKSNNFKSADWLHGVCAHWRVPTMKPSSSHPTGKKLDFPLSTVFSGLRLTVRRRSQYCPLPTNPLPSPSSPPCGPHPHIVAMGNARVGPRCILNAFPPAAVSTTTCGKLANFP